VIISWCLVDIACGLKKEKKKKERDRNRGREREGKRQREDMNMRKYEHVKMLVCEGKKI